MEGKKERNSMRGIRCTSGAKEEKTGEGANGAEWIERGREQRWE